MQQAVLQGWDWINARLLLICDTCAAEITVMLAGFLPTAEVQLAAMD